MPRVDYETWRRTLSVWARSGGRTVALFDSIGSTNEVAAALLPRRERPRSGCWFFAFHQRRGRGRFDRVWVSPRGAGVYASYLLEAPATLLPILPQLVGVALCEALDGLGVACRLKWPNDLLLDGRKLGGILLRARGSGPDIGAVAGFGINYDHEAVELPRQDATSLRLASAAVPALAELTAILAERVEREVAAGQAAADAGPRAVLERYVAWSAHRPGDRLVVQLADEVCSGEFAGFSTSGELRLICAGGERRLSAGEIEA